MDANVEQVAIPVCPCVIEDLEALQQGEENVMAEIEGLTAMAAGSDRQGAAQGLPAEDNPDLRLRVGRHLGIVRKNQGISQEQAAKDIRISRPHLSNVEQGRARTNWEMLQKIATYYKLNLQNVIKDVEMRVPIVEASHHPSSWYLDGEAGKLSPYDQFMLGLFRILTSDRRAALKKHALEMLKQQGDDAS